MSKRNTRVRVTRIAAAAVIAAGASLTAVGAAQAVTNDNPAQVQAKTGPFGDLTVGGTDSGGTLTVGGTSDGGAANGGATDGGAANGGATDGGAANGGATDGGAANGGATDGGAANGGSTGGTAASGGTSTGGTSATGGSSATGGASGGTSTTGGNGNTCTLTGDSVDCGNNNPGTDNTQPVAQGKTTSQLAETGSNGTTFMLIGAATLIAGGVGFRLTPRLARRGGAA
jgi:hypothetical protein